MIEGKWELVGKHGVEGIGDFSRSGSAVMGYINRIKHASDGSPSKIRYEYQGEVKDEFVTLHWKDPGRDARGCMAMRITGDEMTGVSIWNVEGKEGQGSPLLRRAKEGG